VLDKAEYSAFESTLNSSIVSCRIVFSRERFTYLLILKRGGVAWRLFCFFFVSGFPDSLADFYSENVLVIAVTYGISVNSYF